MKKILREKPILYAISAIFLGAGFALLVFALLMDQDLQARQETQNTVLSGAEKVKTSDKKELEKLAFFNQQVKLSKMVLLGSATTSFWGSSADRIHNIALGAQRVSDVVVQPGEVYSFLEHLGEVSVESGYKKEYVISAGSTKKEAGGGVCQVSTTLFRAVLDAGLPVLERRGHGYVVSYYGPGLDATVYGPWVDFKFLNDTGNPIVVKSKTTNSTVSFEIWGIPDGREATTTPIKITDIKEPPKPVYIPDYSLSAGKLWCTEKPARGMKTEVIYTIKRPDGSQDSQIFKTKYKAWGKRCYVGVKIN